MKKLLLLLLLVSLIVCQEACPKEKENDHDRDDRCGKEVHEVCCIDHNSDGTETMNDYINHCQACKSGKCEFTVHGHCSNYPNNAQFCSPASRKKGACPEIDFPVCAYYRDQNCAQKPCDFEVANGCFACQNEKVLYYVMGRCGGNNT